MSKITSEEVVVTPKEAFDSLCKEIEYVYNPHAFKIYKAIVTTALNYYEELKVKQQKQEELLGLYREFYDNIINKDFDFLTTVWGDTEVLKMNELTEKIDNIELEEEMK